MLTYDVHQHLWPEALIAALRARRERPRLRGSVLELPSGDFDADLGAHTLEARLALLDRDEIDVAVISCPPTLELCVELDRRGSLLFVHPGPAPVPPHAPGWWPAVVDYTAQMQAAYAAWLALSSDRWPELRVLFAILAGGAPFQLERLASRGIDSRGVVRPNVFLDTASYGERALDLTLATYGVGQLVYGSDVPVIDSGPTLRSVRSFGQAVADVVCRDNPARLLE